MKAIHKIMNVECPEFVDGVATGNKVTRVCLIISEETYIGKLRVGAKYGSIILPQDVTLEEAIEETANADLSNVKLVPKEGSSFYKVVF